MRTEIIQIENDGREGPVHFIRDWLAGLGPGARITHVVATQITNTRPGLIVVAEVSQDDE